MQIDGYRGSPSIRDALDKLERDGVALFPRGFDDAEIDRLCASASDIVSNDRLNRDRCGPHVNMVFWPAAVSPPFAALRTDRRFFAIVRKVLHTVDIKQHIQHVFYRGPDNPDSFRWHCDEIFRGSELVEARRNYLQTALFLDDVDGIEQGALVFVPGSHRWEADARLASAEAIQARQGGAWPFVGYERAEALLPRRGMIAAWNPGTIHGSQPNTTRRNRRYVLQGYARGDAVEHPDYKWAWRRGEAVELMDSKGGGETLGRSYERARS